MKPFVLLSAVIEIIAGIIFLFFPRLIPDFAQASAGHVGLIRMYGAAALALGFFAFQVWQHMRSQVMQNAFLQTYLIFNVGVAVAIYTCYVAGVFSDLGGTILHTVLALVTAFFYFKKRQATTTTD